MKTVIEMAGEVDTVTKILLDRKVPQGMSHDVFLLFLERFAKIARADEREAIKQIIRETPFSNWFQSDLIEAIDKRGQA